MTMTTNKIDSHKDIEVINYIGSVLKDDILLLEKRLKTACESQVALIPILSDHLLGAGGKRLRPLVALAMGRALGVGSGVGSDKLVNLAVAIEFLHTASLLHDDVVDESPLRRNRSTANQIWGNQAAILVGDYMFASAFQLMVKAGNMQVMEALANATAALAEGEVMELQLISDLNMPKQDYLTMIGKKTAYLFAAAGEIGAIMAEDQNFETQYVKHAFDYGMALGMGFQLIDDVMDYESQSAVMGKKTGNDFREGKITLPILLLMDKASHDEKQMLQTMFQPNYERNEDDFEKIFLLLQKYDCLNDSRKLAFDYAVDAEHSIHEIKNSLSSTSKDTDLLISLGQLAKATISRQS